MMYSTHALKSIYFMWMLPCTAGSAWQLTVNVLETFRISKVFLESKQMIQGLDTEFLN